MQTGLIKSLSIICAIGALAGCATYNANPIPTQSLQSSTQLSQSSQNASTTTVASIPAAQSTSQSISEVDSHLAEFVNTDALLKMSEGDKTQASSAQYFALQTGRPGAPRNWSGAQGATGEIVVGPFVRVNNLDCREFTHTVTIGGEKYSKTGTSCRENGQWNVV